MRVVVALGGNALQKRGEPMTVENQRANVRSACRALTPVGDGARAGDLARQRPAGRACSSLQASSYDEESTYPFDVLGAQTEGMIGYFIEQELGNLLPFEKPIATILTMTEVDADDPAMKDPTKFVGPVYTEDDAHAPRGREGLDGQAGRRALAPRRAVAGAASASSRSGRSSSCSKRHRRDLHRRRRHPDDVPAGGAARLRPTTTTRARSSASRRSSTRTGRSAVLAQDLDADLLVIATDADAVYLDWGTPAAAGDHGGLAGRDRGLRLPGRARWGRRSRRRRSSRGRRPGRVAVDRGARRHPRDPRRHQGHPHQHRRRRGHLPLSSGRPDRNRVAPGRPRGGESLLVGHVEVAKVTHTLPDGRVLLDEVSLPRRRRRQGRARRRQRRRQDHADAAGVRRPRPAGGRDRALRRPRRHAPVHRPGARRVDRARPARVGVAAPRARRGRGARRRRARA